MKKNKSKKLVRLLLKTGWFCLTAIMVCVTGVVLFLCVMALTDPKTSKDLIAVTVITSVALIALLILYVFISRKSKRLFLRWTKKSFIILSPLVVVAMILTAIPLSRLDESAIGVSSPEGLAGKQSYVEGLSFKTDKLLSLSNKERAKNGKSPLTLNAKLNDSALSKCKDMVSSNYWSHIDNEGREPWRFINTAGYQYSKAGENLAYGFPSETAVVTGWMNSEGHRKNLLDDYKEVGFGVCLSNNFVDTGKQLIVVQHLANPGNASTAQRNPKTGGVYSPKPYVASVCTKTTIPYQTVYEDADYMYVGETQAYGGWNGYKETCTADSTGYKPPDYTSPPYKKTIYGGTKTRSSGSSSTPPASGTSPSPSCTPDGQGGYQC